MVTLRLTLCTLFLAASAWAATGRFGNAARKVSSPNHIARVFIGRGMVVPAVPRDFFRMTETQVATDTDGDSIADVFDPDNDNDDLGDLAEIEQHGTDANRADTDTDGMPDGWELTNGFTPTSNADGDGDADSDDATNTQEYTHGSDPRDPDSDDDQMWDGWEITFSLNPTWAGDATEDPDFDDLENLEEYTVTTNPRDDDSDDDEMLDGWEVDQDFNPLDPTDADADADGDGYPNRYEFLNDTDPHLYLLKLTAGWNVLSIARLPRDNRVSTLLKRRNIGPVWTWTDGAYERTDELLPLRGHWVYVLEATDIEIELP